MFSSIRARLTLSHLIVIVIAMGLSGFVLLSLLERYFLEAMEDSLAAQAQITAQALVPGVIAWAPAGENPASVFNTVQQMSSNISLQAQNVAPATTNLSDVDLSYLANASLQLSSQLETRIRILDMEGMTLVDSQPADDSAGLETDPLVMDALAGRYGARTDKDDSETVMHLAMPVVVEDKLAGVVFLSQPLHDALAVVQALRIRWLISTGIALLLSAAVGLLLSRAISHPLHQLTDAAGAVARGRFDQQVSVSGRDEVGRLGRAFNEMVRRLQAAHQMQVDFVANVSHELRTPLTAIKGTVETLRDGAVDDPSVRDRFLGTVETETDRLIRLVTDLLILSRADSEALNLQFEPTPIEEIIETVVERMIHQAEFSSLTLLVETARDMPAVLVDRDRIEQVLMNLLDNAIKYSRAGGIVLIHAGVRAEGPVYVQIEDQGIGIPADDLPRIGERFYRADRARSRAHGGSGLGLAIARALVEAHGGRLSVESVEGAGTTVAFTLQPA